MSKQGDSPDYEYRRQMWERQRRGADDFHLVRNSFTVLHIVFCSAVLER